MKPVADLTVPELFDRLSLAIYYGPALRAAMHGRPGLRKAAQDLLAEIREDEYLREQTEK
jgi:hypothetical protein